MDEKPLDRIKGWFWWSLINAVWLLPLAYGIKCLATQNGQFIGTRRSGPYANWQYALIPVQGEAAVWAGAGYVAVGVFLGLFMYSKFDADRSFVGQLILVLIRWGSLAASLWFWHKAGLLL